MPNQRAPGQKLLTIPVDQAFFAFMDRGVREGGYASRSDLARWAIREELQRLGIEVPKAVISAPNRALKQNQRAVDQQVPTILPNDSVGESEPVRVSPLTEIGPPKGQLAITEEARMASLEAQLPPGLLDAVMDDALMEVANRGLRSAGSGGAPPSTIPAPPPAPVAHPAKGSKSSSKRSRGDKK